MEDKQLYIEKCWLSCIKSLQGLLNVNFDTECKMLRPRLEKFFEDKFFTELLFPKNWFLMVSYLTKLRISAHQLYVETGRYCNPAILREKRFCFHCKNIVEDDKHFFN